MSLIILNGLKLDFFEIDSYTIIIYFILNLTFLARGFHKTMPATEKISIKQELKEARKIVDLAVKTVRITSNSKDANQAYETLRMDKAKELLSSDPHLAIAAVNMEIDEIVSSAKRFLKLSGNRHSVARIIDLVKKKEIIDQQQGLALKALVNICTKAVSGNLISKSEARDIIRLAEKFNKAFAFGSSINFRPNEDYQTQGLLCEWAHCIKLMPLIQESGGSFCPRFGHDCPGGKEKAVSCSQTIVNLANKVYVEMIQTSLFDQIKN